MCAISNAGASSDGIRDDAKRELAVGEEVEAGVEVGEGSLENEVCNVVCLES